MASDSVPSFRTRMKDKFKKKLEKHNITSFIPPVSTSSNDTDSSSSSWRQKYNDLKGVAKNFTNYETYKNKTKEYISPTDKNQTDPTGFYDSLFNPKTDNDTYLKVGIICLWIIAILCIILTIITILIPVKNKTKTKKPSARGIFFHIFLCEFCYLIYILLAWINAGVNFQLVSFLCDFANYGVYVTIPVMQFALLVLSLERITSRFKTTCAKIFTKSYTIQIILFTIWGICIAIIMTIMLLRKQFSTQNIKDKVGSFAPAIVNGVLTKIISRPYQCSIDGRLSSIFKVVLIILFIVLIVLIIKSMVFTMGFSSLIPKCCESKEKKKEKDNHRITILFVIFLLLNLCFAFPFYFTSMFDNIFTRISSTKAVYTSTVKICFIFRLLSIIFECLTYCTFEKKSWDLISKMFYMCTCKKITALKVVDANGYRKQSSTKKPHLPTDSEEDDDEDDPPKQSSTKKPRRPNDSVVDHRKPSSTKKSYQPIDSDDDDDDDDPPKTSSTKKPRRRNNSDVEDNIKMIDNDENDNSDPNEDNGEEEEDDEKLRKQRLKAKNEAQKKAKVYQTDENDNKKVRKEPKRQGTKVKKHEIEVKAEVHESDKDDEDDVFLDELMKQQPKAKKPEVIAAIEIDSEDDGEKPVVQKSKLSNGKNPVVAHSSQGSDDDDDEEEEEEEQSKVPIPKSTVKSSKTNGTAVQISNGKHASHQIPSTEAAKTIKRQSSTDQNNNKRRSTQPPPPPPDEISDDNIASDVETKPSTNGQKRTTPVVSNEHHRQHRTKSLPSSRPTARALPQTTSHHHNHATSTKRRHKSPRNANTDKEKQPKKDRLSKILDMSHEV